MLINNMTAAASLEKLARQYTQKKVEAHSASPDFIASWEEFIKHRAQLSKIKTFCR